MALAATFESREPDTLELCRMVLESPVIPFEREGAVTGESLLNIAGTAAVALSSVMVIVDFQRVRLLLVAVPNGIVLTGNASSVDEAQHLGLGAGLRRLVGLDGARRGPA